MFPDGCTLPGSTQQRILVVLLKTSQTGVQHFWKRHVRLGGIGLPSILGFHREDIHGNCVRAEVPPDLLESQKGSGYISTSGQLEAIADNSRSTALQSS